MKRRVSPNPEQEQSRRALIVETLNAALSKDLAGMQVALSMLSEGDLFTEEENFIATSVINELEQIELKIPIVYAPADTHIDRFREVQREARTLLDEVSAFRESAFWLLERGGVLDVEKLINRQVAAYEQVRRLLRFIIASDDATMPEDPARIPEIPANRYLRLTHPEVFRSK